MRVLFGAAATFAFVMAVMPHPPRLPGAPSDKVQHIVAFATLAFIGAFAYPRASILRLLVGLCLFGALIEFVQSIPALNRDSDIMDLIADTIASLVILLLVRRPWRPSPLD